MIQKSSSNVIKKKGKGEELRDDLEERKEENKETIFQRMTISKKYNEILIQDQVFKLHYSNMLCQAVFTFPMFKRSFSKNYKAVQMSFRKTTKSNFTL